MTNPIEKQVYNYIAARRPLRWLLIITTAVGIGKGVYDAFAPLAIAASRPIIKWLGLPPTPAESQKYGCAIAIPHNLQNISDFALSKNAKSSDVTSRRIIFVTSRNQIDECRALLGFQERLEPIGTLPTDSSEHEKFFMHSWERVNAQLFAFSRYLAHTDAPSSALYILATEMVALEDRLKNCFANKHCDLMAAPTEEMAQVSQLRAAADRADDQFSYRLPKVDFNVTSKPLLWKSINCYRNGLSILAAGQPPIADSTGELKGCPYVK